MRDMRRSASLIAALAALAACGQQSTVDDALKADLDAAATATIEMAPRGQGTQVVSSIESKRPTQPRVTPVRQVKAPARTPKPETPQITQASAPEPVATRPASTPAVSPPPPGGYKSVGEVIRNAPFPIKP
jgi:predicted small lipoprotein YifL